MTLILALFTTTLTASATTRIALCEALLHLSAGHQTGHQAGTEVATAALELTGRREPVHDPEAYRFDVNTTLTRLRRWPDGLSGKTVAIARLIALEAGDSPREPTLRRVITGRAQIATELKVLTARVAATDADVAAELRRLYPPDRLAAHATRVAKALAIVPPLALAAAGLPAAAVLASPAILLPAGALHLLYAAAHRDAVRADGFTTHVARIRRALFSSQPDVVMFSGAVQLPHRLARRLMTPTNDLNPTLLRDLALAAEDTARLPFESRQRPDDVETRELYYDSVFIGGPDPRWLLATRIVTQSSTAPDKPALKR